MEWYSGQLLTVSNGEPRRLQIDLNPDELRTNYDRPYTFRFLSRFDGHSA